MPVIESETVSVMRCKRYQNDSVHDSIALLLKPWGGIEGIVRPGNKVMLKPNLLAAVKPEEAVTTHPLIIKVLTELIQEAGGQVCIGDSPGGDDEDHTYSETGMLAVAQETGARLIKFDRVKQKDYDGIRKRSLELAAAIDEVDLIINVAKLKTHPLTGLTGAVKNIYGCVAGKAKGRMHFDYPLPLEFSRLLIDVYMAVKPAFSIIDAVIAMEGIGPRRGKARNTGLLLASRNAVALDTVAAAITGFQPGQVTTQIVASELGLPGTKISEIFLHGLSLEEALIHDFDRGTAANGKVGRLISRFPVAWVRGLRERKRPYPQINALLCNGCGKCAEGCPAQIMHLNSKTPSIDLSACIRCYCCREFCPCGAVELTGR
jgi:uncharacterized protein (DUF362 family)/NAD-dependent dihydropyrimidine dehydrogenase PreA subunit